MTSLAPFPFYNNPSGQPPYEASTYIPFIDLEEYEAVEPRRIRIHKEVRQRLGAATSIRLDLECTICEGLVCDPSIELQLGECTCIAPNVELIQPIVGDSSAPMEIGKFTVVGPHSIVAATKIGSYCEIGHHAKIGQRCFIQDGCIIAPFSNLPPDTVCPSGTIWAGNPGVYVGDSPADVSSVLERKCRDIRENLIGGPLGGPDAS